MSQRPSKPTKLKVLEGNRGKRPLPESEPTPKPKAPKCPADLDKDAKGVWDRLAPMLERLGLLTEADGDMFAHLCQIRARLVNIHKYIKKHNSGEDVVYDTRPVSQYITLEKQYYDIFRRYAAEFGLSPRGRVGLVVGQDKENEGEDLIK